MPLMKRNQTHNICKICKKPTQVVLIKFLDPKHWSHLGHIWPLQRKKGLKHLLLVFNDRCMELLLFCDFIVLSSLACNIILWCFFNMLAVSNLYLHFSHATNVVKVGGNITFLWDLIFITSLLWPVTSFEFYEGYFWWEFNPLSQDN